VPVTGAGCWCGTSIKPWAHVVRTELVMRPAEDFGRRPERAPQVVPRRGCSQSTGDVSRIGPCEDVVNLKRAAAQAAPSR
jgi:hypothetical protein